MLRGQRYVQLKILFRLNLQDVQDGQDGDSDDHDGDETYPVLSCEHADEEGLTTELGAPLGDEELIALDGCVEILAILDIEAELGGREFSW